MKQTEIDRFYSPKYFGSQMSRQEILFQENLRVLMHSKNCAVGSTKWRRHIIIYLLSRKFLSCKFKKHKEFANNKKIYIFAL